MIFRIYKFKLGSGVFNFNYGVSKYIVKYDPTSKDVETIEPRYEGDLNTIRITPPLTNGRFSNSTGIIQLFKDVQYSAKNYILSVLDFDNNLFNVSITISCEALAGDNIDPVRYLSVGDYSSYQLIPGFHYKIPLQMSGTATSCVVNKNIEGFTLNTKYYEGEMLISNKIDNEQLTFYCYNDKSETNKISFNISSLNSIPLDSFHGLKLNEWKWNNKINNPMNCGLINPNNNHYTKITERTIVKSFIEGNENDYMNGRSYNGYIKIEESNKYSFKITTNSSSSGAYLRINHNYIIRGCPVSVDGIYESSSTIDLKKGIYEIEVFYYNMNGLSKNLKLEWKKSNEAEYSVISDTLYYISPNTILSYDKEILTVNYDEKNVILNPIVYTDDDNDIKNKIVKYTSKPSMKSVGLILDENTGKISGNISTSKGNEKEYTIIGTLASGIEVSCVIHINIIDDIDNNKVIFNIVKLGKVNKIMKDDDNDESLLKKEKEVESQSETIVTTTVRGINTIIYSDNDDETIMIQAENADTISVYDNNNKQLEDDVIMFDSKMKTINITECINGKIDAVINSNNNHYYLTLICKEKERVCEESSLKKLTILSSESELDMISSISNGIYLNPSTVYKNTNVSYCIPNDLLINLQFKESDENDNKHSISIKVNDVEVTKSTIIPFSYLLDVRSGKINSNCTDIYGVKSIKMPTQNYRFIPICVPSKTIKDCTVLPNTNDFTCEPNSGIIIPTSKTATSGTYAITLKYIGDDDDKEYTVPTTLTIELSDEIDDYFPLRELKLPIEMGNFINGKYSETPLLMSGNAKECVGTNLPYGMSLKLVDNVYSIVGNPIYLDSDNYTMSLICRNDLSDSYSVNYTYYILNDYARGIRGIFYNNNNVAVKDTVLQISTDGKIELPNDVISGTIYTYLNLQEDTYRISVDNNIFEVVSYMINDKIYNKGESIFIYQYSSLTIEFREKQQNKRSLQQTPKSLQLEILNENSGKKVEFSSSSLLCNPKEVDISTIDVKYDGSLFRFPVLTNSIITPLNSNEELQKLVDCVIINRVNVSSHIKIENNCVVNINQAELGSYTLIIQPYTMVKECKRVEITIEIRSCNDDEPNMVEYILEKENDVAYIISPTNIIVDKINTEESGVKSGIKCLPNGIYKTKGKVSLKINGYKFTDSLNTIEIDGVRNNVIIGENQILYYSLDIPSNHNWYLPSVNVKDWDNILGNETIATTKNDLYIKTDYNLQSQNEAITSFVIEMDNLFVCSIYVNGVKLFSQDTVDKQLPKIRVIPPHEILYLNGVNTIGIEIHDNSTGLKTYFPNLKISKYNDNTYCIDATSVLTNKNNKMIVKTNVTKMVEGTDLSLLFRNDDYENNNGIKFATSKPISLLFSFADKVQFPISNFGFKENGNKQITSVSGVKLYGYNNDDSEDKVLLLSDMSIPTYPIDSYYYTNLTTTTNYKYYNITLYHNNNVITLNRIYFDYCLPITCPSFDEYNVSLILDNYNISSIYYEDDYELQCIGNKWEMTNTNQIEAIRDFKYDFSEYTIIKEESIPFSIIPSYKGIIRDLKCDCGDGCTCDGNSDITFDKKSGRISAINPPTTTPSKYILNITDGTTLLQTITFNIVDKFDGCKGENVWPNTAVGDKIRLECVDGQIGYRYRKCLTGSKWGEIDKTNCRNIDINENNTNIVKFEYNVTVSTVNKDFDTLFDEIRSELLHQWRNQLQYNSFPSPNIADIKIEYTQPEIRQLSTSVQLRITLSVEITPNTTYSQMNKDYKVKLDNAFSEMKGDNKIFSTFLFSSLTDSLFAPTTLVYCKVLKPYYNQTCQESNEKWIINQFDSFTITPEDNMYYHYNEYDIFKYSIIENGKKDRKVYLNNANGEITIDSTLTGSNNLTIIVETSKGKQQYILNYEIYEKKCVKDGYWNETELGKTVEKNCTDGYIGIEYRQCSENGEWNDVNRENCIYSNIPSKPSKGDDVYIKINITYTNSPVRPERILRELEDKLSFNDWEVRDAYKRKLSELSGIDINDISIESVSDDSFILIIKANDRNNEEISKKVSGLINDGSIINAMKNEDIRYSDLQTNSNGIKYETINGEYDEPVIHEEVDNSLKDGALAGVIIAGILGGIAVILFVFIVVNCFLSRKKE